MFLKLECGRDLVNGEAVLVGVASVWAAGKEEGKQEAWGRGACGARDGPCDTCAERPGLLGTRDGDSVFLAAAASVYLFEAIVTHPQAFLPSWLLSAPELCNYL